MTSFVNDKDMDRRKRRRRYTAFRSTSYAQEQASCICKTSKKNYNPKFEHIPASDIAGKWVQCAWCIGLSAACLDKEAADDNTLLYNGWMCCCGLPCRVSDQRYYRVPGTNNFHPEGQPENLEWFITSSRLRQPTSVGWKRS